MSDEKFEKMDQAWMKATEELREKKVSDGILKGFSASVERRIAGEAPKLKPVRTLAWAPAMVVLVIASVLVLRSPMSVEYAQLPDNTDNIDEEIAALREVGAWGEADEALLGGVDEAGMDDLELSHLGHDQATLV